MNRIAKMVLCAIAAGGIILAAGCKTEMPKPTGFLSDYGRLTEVNDSTWQYVDASALAGCDKFIIPPVKVTATEYLGTTFSENQQQKLGESFHAKIVKAVSAKYQVVTTPSPSTGEIRVAFTRVYRLGNSVAIGAEVEIVGAESRKQLAALTGVKIGPPEMGINTNPQMMRDPSDPGRYIEAWWNKPAADELMNRWADNIVRIIEDSKKK